MVEKIKKRLDDYLEFDSTELFNSGDLIRVFGGAIRDSICGDPINDIDVLVGPRSIKSVENLLLSKGYYYMDSLLPKNLGTMYHDIHCISEPHTWIKNNKIVQLIRPCDENQRSIDMLKRSGINEVDLADMKKLIEDKNLNSYMQNYKNLISNVDISCCGVSYDGVLYENVFGSIEDCIKKIFSVNVKASMYSENRTNDRRYKLLGRGWVEVKDRDARDHRIDIIFSDNSDNYFVKEWLDYLKQHVKFGKIQ